MTLPEITKSKMIELSARLGPKNTIYLQNAIESFCIAFPKEHNIPFNEKRISITESFFSPDNIYEKKENQFLNKNLKLKNDSWNALSSLVVKESNELLKLFEANEAFDKIKTDIAKILSDLGIAIDPVDNEISQKNVIKTAHEKMNIVLDYLDWLEKNDNKSLFESILNKHGKEKLKTAQSKTSKARSSFAKALKSFNDHKSAPAEWKEDLENFSLGLEANTIDDELFLGVGNSIGVILAALKLEETESEIEANDVVKNSFQKTIQVLDRLAQNAFSIANYYKTLKNTKTKEDWNIIKKSFDRQLTGVKKEDIKECRLALNHINPILEIVREKKSPQYRTSKAKKTDTGLATRICPNCMKQINRTMETIICPSCSKIMIPSARNHSNFANILTFCQKCQSNNRLESLDDPNFSCIRCNQESPSKTPLEKLLKTNACKHCGNVMSFGASYKENITCAMCNELADFKKGHEVPMTRISELLSHINLPKYNIPIEKHNIVEEELSSSETFKKPINNEELKSKIGTPPPSYIEWIKNTKYNNPYFLLLPLRGMKDNLLPPQKLKERVRQVIEDASFGNNKWNILKSYEELYNGMEPDIRASGLSPNNAAMIVIDSDINKNSIKEQFVKGLVFDENGKPGPKMQEIKNWLESIPDQYKDLAYGRMTSNLNDKNTSLFERAWNYKDEPKTQPEEKQNRFMNFLKRITKKRFFWFC